jgi:hypothetical protein
MFLVFAILIFVLHFYTVQKAKCRNDKINLCFYLISTVLGFYFSWVSFFINPLDDLISSKAALSLSLNPLELFEFMKSSFAQSPYWNSCFWIIELIGFLFLPILSYSTIKETVFCENCNKWANNEGLILKLSFESIEQLKDIAENNISKLNDLQIYQNNQENHIVVNLQSCESCTNSYMVDFDLVKTTDSNGNRSEVKEKFSPVIFVDQTNFEELKIKVKVFQSALDKEKTDTLSENDGDNSQIIAADYVPELVLEEIENSDPPLKLTLFEKFFMSKLWRWSIITISVVLLPTYIIELFLPLDSSIEYCVSKEKVKTTRRDGFDNYDYYQWSIRSKNENGVQNKMNFYVPEETGELMKEGGKIIVYRTKWRKEVNQFQLEDGFIYNVDFPNGMFYFFIGLYLYTIYFLRNAPVVITTGKRRDQIAFRFIYIIQNTIFSGCCILGLAMTIDAFF